MFKNYLEPENIPAGCIPPAFVVPVGGGGVEYLWSHVPSGESTPLDTLPPPRYATPPPDTRTPRKLHRTMKEPGTRDTLPPPCEQIDRHL